MAHATFCNHALGEVMGCPPRALQYRDLHAAIVVEMHMHRRQRQVVVILKGARKARFANSRLSWSRHRQGQLSQPAGRYDRDAGCLGLRLTIEPFFGSKTTSAHAADFAAELLLVDTTGDIQPPRRRSARIGRRGTARAAQREAENLADMIETLFLNTPKLGMFVRGEPVSGWNR